jgi:hypothetical protein
VVIGDAQGGGWIIAWDDQHVVAKGSDPVVVNIGPGSELAGRVLQIITTAVDIRSQTNRLSCTVTLDGGVQGKQQVVSTWDDGSDGDAAIFATVIGFE